MWSGRDKCSIKKNKAIQWIENAVWDNKVAIFSRMIREGLPEGQSLNTTWMKRGSQSGEDLGEVTSRGEIQRLETAVKLAWQKNSKEGPKAGAEGERNKSWDVDGGRVTPTLWEKIPKAVY